MSAWSSHSLVNELKARNVENAAAAAAASKGKEEPAAGSPSSTTTLGVVTMPSVWASRVVDSFTFSGAAGFESGENREAEGGPMHSGPYAQHHPYAPRGYHHHHHHHHHPFQPFFFNPRPMTSYGGGAFGAIPIAYARQQQQAHQPPPPPHQHHLYYNPHALHH